MISLYDTSISQGGSIMKYNGSRFQIYMNDALKGQHIDLNTFPHLSVKLTTKDNKYYHSSKVSDQYAFSWLPIEPSNNPSEEA